MSFQSSSGNDEPDDGILLDVSEFLVDSEAFGEAFSASSPTHTVNQQNPYHENEGDGRRSSNSREQRDVEVETHWVAFKIKSELEILDDGYKWRKYGKKMMKNSSNPRNYFRCSSEGCYVKKRVERDREDGLYVITSYQGKHNHQAPLTRTTPRRAF